MGTGAPLVGRDAELGRVDDLLSLARAGRSLTVALRGEAGVGKSALVAAAVERASDLRVLRARGVPSEYLLPFAGLADVLRPILFLLDRLPEPQAEALQGALALRPSRSHDRFAIGSAVHGLLVASADLGPTLVAVDDAHWIDGSSADALSFALRRLVADPVVALVAVRDGHPSALADAALERWDLTGLDLAATARLVTSAVGHVDDALVARLHRESGGNPLALLESVRDGGALRGPHAPDSPLPVMTSVAELYLERVRALPPGASSVLLLAACGDVSDLALLDRAAGAMGASVTDLASAEDSGLVTTHGGRAEFPHPLIRSAAYNDATPDQRRRAHRALADALPDRDADRRAWHLALAALGPDAVASSAMAQAGGRALERNAYDVASRAYETAGDLAPSDPARADLLRRAAECAWDAGLAPRAEALVDRATALEPDEGTGAALERLRGRVEVRAGPVQSGLAHLLSAARRFAPGSPDEAVAILAEAVQSAFYAGDSATMMTAAADSRALAARTSAPRARFLAATSEGMALTFAGRAGEGAERLHDAMALVPTVTDDDASWHVWVALCTLWLRENDARRDRFDRAAEAARSESALGALLYLLCYLAIDDASSERWTDAEAGLHQVIDLARETGQRTDLAVSLARLAVIEARQGREDVCRLHAAESLDLATALGVGVAEVWARFSLGELELALGRTTEAIEQFSAQRAILTTRGIADADLDPAPELVELHLRNGDAELARSAAAAFRDRAAEKGLPWAEARAGRAWGLVADGDDVDPVFEAALAAHGRTPDRFETARTQLAYGERLRRDGHRRRSREQLRAAADSFDRLGARPWADRARAELAATGLTVAARSASTLDALTPQELQVALLLAGGRTTREAAAALFLSPKTVEYHLRHAYRKLGCHDRDGLAAALEPPRAAD